LLLALVVGGFGLVAATTLGQRHQRTEKGDRMNNLQEPTLPS
jgi:hypothetical protein